MDRKTPKTTSPKDSFPIAAITKPILILDILDMSRHVKGLTIQYGKQFDSYWAMDMWETMRNFRRGMEQDNLEAMHNSMISVSIQDFQTSDDWLWGLDGSTYGL